MNMTPEIGFPIPEITSRDSRMVSPEVIGAVVIATTRMPSHRFSYDDQGFQ
jgi:hypothetical protein